MRTHPTRRRRIRTTAVLVLLILLTSIASRGRADEPSDLPIMVDESLFPEAYGVLGADRLMYPVDMADWPVRITNQHQLFIDDFLIADRTDVTRRLHSLSRHAANPVLRLREKPWEMSIGHSAIVMPQENGYGYRLWYNVRNFVEGEDGLRYRAPTCYAESDDGLTWTKPELGLYRFNADSNNNITLLQGTIEALFREPDDPDPGRRYKAVVWHDPHGQTDYAPREGFYLYWSPDGLHWQGDNQRCIMPNGQTHVFPDQPADGVGDTTVFRWDSRLQKYVSSVKILFRNPTLRTAGFSESDDLIHWSRPRMTLHRDKLDGPDAQIYEHITFEYESVWIGLVRVMHTERTGWKQVDVELSVSHDGRNWTRVCRGQRFLELGGDDAWDADYLIPARPGAPIRVGNQLRFYYWGARRKDKRDNSEIRYDMHIGVASLRPDGFVSLDAGDAPGQVITRPLTFDGGTLFVNADIAADGYLKAEWQDASGKPLPGCQMDECKPLQGDVMSGRVRWQDVDQIQRSTDQPVRLAFELKNAKLYSFWIE